MLSSSNTEEVSQDSFVFKLADRQIDRYNHKYKYDATLHNTNYTTLHWLHLIALHKLHNNYYNSNYYNSNYNYYNSNYSSKYYDDDDDDGYYYYYDHHHHHSYNYNDSYTTLHYTTLITLQYMTATNINTLPYATLHKTTLD